MTVAYISGCLFLPNLGAVCRGKGASLGHLPSRGELMGVDQKPLGLLIPLGGDTRLRGCLGQMRHLWGG